MPAPLFALILICLGVLGAFVIYSASRAWLTDLVYPLRRRPEGAIGLLGYYVVWGLLGWYLSLILQQPYPYVFIAVATGWAAFLRGILPFYGGVKILRREICQSIQLVVALLWFAFVVLASVLNAPLNLPPELMARAWTSLSLSWFPAFFMTATELVVWFFMSIDPATQRALKSDMDERFRQLEGAPKKQEACGVLVDILSCPNVGIEIAELERSSGIGYSDLEPLLDLLVENGQIVRSSHSVMKHPFYPLEKQEEIAARLARRRFIPKEIEHALRDALQDLSKPAALAVSILFEVPEVKQKLNNSDLSVDDKVKALQDLLCAAIEALQQKPEQLGDKKARHKQDAYEVISRIADGVKNERVWKNLRISKSEGQRRVTNAIRYIWETLLEQPTS